MTKVNGLIEKWGLQLAVRNGQEGFTVTKGRADVATVAEMRELKPEILAELHRREDEFLAATRAKAAAVKAAHEEKIRAIKTGEKNIELRWHDGEYLSGWEAIGEAGELLEGLGLARYVDGWGYHVKADVEEALGETFTYAAAVKLAQPKLDAEAAKKAAAETERQAKFAEARETGKPVFLEKWSEPCSDPREECSLDIVAQYAMPDGGTETRRQHTW